MAAKFLSGTPLSQIEFEMQLIPGFRPRKSGLAVSRYLYSAADCDCRYCTERAEKKKTSCPACVCLRERLVAGCVGLNDLRRIVTAGNSQRAFVARVEALSQEPRGFFVDAPHRLRFQQAVTVNMSPACGAALYLLTAHPPLWQAAQPALTDHAVRFQDIRLHGMDVDGYALFHAAKDLYCGTEHISLSELADPEVIGDEVFRLIVDAILIRRYGTVLISIFKEDTEC